MKKTIGTNIRIHVGGGGGSVGDIVGESDAEGDVVGKSVVVGESDVEGDAVLLIPPPHTQHA